MLKDNKIDLEKLDDVLCSVEKWAHDQYGLIYSYIKENNCSFADGLLNSWMENRLRKTVFYFDIPNSNK